MASVEEYAEALADGIEAALATWVVGCITAVMDRAGRPMTPEIGLAAEVAGELARREAGAAVRDLLRADVDEQATTPLAILRWAVRYPTEVLYQTGVPPLERDRFVQAAFPDDIYGLSPSSFADIDPALAELGIVWGAAKAFEHRRRHRSAE